MKLYPAIAYLYSGTSIFKEKFTEIVGQCPLEKKLNRTVLLIFSVTKIQHVTCMHACMYKANYTWTKTDVLHLYSHFIACFKILRHVLFPFFRSWESLMVVWIYFRNIVSRLKLAKTRGKTYLVETQTEACKCLKTYILIRILARRSYILESLHTTKLITWPISLRFPSRIWCWNTYQKAGFWILLYGWSVNIKLFWKMNLT